MPRALRSKGSPAWGLRLPHGARGANAPRRRTPHQGVQGKGCWRCGVPVSEGCGLGAWAGAWMRSRTEPASVGRVHAPLTSEKERGRCRLRQSKNHRLAPAVKGGLSRCTAVCAADRCRADGKAPQRACPWGKRLRLQQLRTVRGVQAQRWQGAQDGRFIWQDVGWALM